MSFGGIFSLIADDCKADRMRMATQVFNDILQASYGFRTYAKQNKSEARRIKAGRKKERYIKQKINDDYDKKMSTYFKCVDRLIYNSENKFWLPREIWKDISEHVVHDALEDKKCKLRETMERFDKYCNGSFGFSFKPDKYQPSGHINITIGMGG
jgi:hypothetical protein